MTALDVAHYLLSLERMNPMKLNKLCYLCFGWYSVLRKEQLFEDRIEAWQYGPVIPLLYHYFRQYGRDDIDIHIHSADIARSNKKLDVDQKKMIKFVHKSYPYTALELSNITHREGTPWKRTWDGEEGKVVPLHLIEEHFMQLYKK